jgi:hypothetical protein
MDTIAAGMLAARWLWVPLPGLRWGPWPRTLDRGLITTRLRLRIIRRQFRPICPIASGSIIQMVRVLGSAPDQYGGFFKNCLSQKVRLTKNPARESGVFV